MSCLGHDFCVRSPSVFARISLVVVRESLRILVAVPVGSLDLSIAMRVEPWPIHVWIVGVDIATKAWIIDMVDLSKRRFPIQKSRVTAMFALKLCLHAVHSKFVVLIWVDDVRVGRRFLVAYREGTVIVSW